MKIKSHITSAICFGLFASSLSAQDFYQELFAPYEHTHSSTSGTPIVHSFGIEPAFTGRDLFVTHSYTTGSGVTEHETELEMEWGITKRFGVIFEMPYIVEDEEGVATAEGLGDLVIVPRVLLIAQDRFMLTAQIEVGLPTGSSAFGNETALAPGVSIWNDLGAGFTLNSAVAVEHNFDGDETELEFGIGLVKTFGDTAHDHSCKSNHTHSHSHVHRASGLLNLHLEITGGTPLNGDDEGDFETEALFGVSYGLFNSMDVRLAYSVPLSTPRDFDHRWTCGFIYHF